MYIVKAKFEDEDQAKSEYENLVKENPFLANYSNAVEDTIVIRCSDREKAKEIKKILDDATSPNEIETEEIEEDGNGEGKIKKISEGMKKVQGGFQTAQKASAAASNKMGRASQAPKGGMLNQMFNEEGQKGEFIQVVLEFPSISKTTSFIEHMVENKQWNQRGFSLSENGVEVTISNEKGVNILKEEAEKYDVENVEVRK